MEIGKILFSGPTESKINYKLSMGAKPCDLCLAMCDISAMCRVMCHEECSNNSATLVVILFCTVVVSW